MLNILNNLISLNRLNILSRIVSNLETASKLTSNERTTVNGRLNLKDLSILSTNLLRLNISIILNSLSLRLANRNIRHRKLANGIINLLIRITSRLLRNRSKDKRPNIRHRTTNDRIKRRILTGLLGSKLLMINIRLLRLRTLDRDKSTAILLLNQRTKDLILLSLSLSNVTRNLSTIRTGIKLSRLINRLKNITSLSTLSNSLSNINLNLLNLLSLINPNSNLSIIGINASRNLIRLLKITITTNSRRTTLNNRIINILSNLRISNGMILNLSNTALSILRNNAMIRRRLSLIISLKLNSLHEERLSLGDIRK